MNKLAQVNIGPTYGSPFGQSKGIADLVSIIVSNAVAFAGIIFLILLIFGGFSVIMGAGENNPEKAAKGKTAVTTAIVGFLIVFTAYWVVIIIQRVFGLGSGIISPNP